MTDKDARKVLEMVLHDTGQDKDNELKELTLDTFEAYLKIEREKKLDILMGKNINKTL